MHFPLSALLLAASLTSTLAKPVPSTNFNDIERRWSEGQSEAQIHAAHSIREATPAWPVARAAEVATFETTTDERSINRSRRRTRIQKRNDATLIAKMKDFVDDVWRSKGETGMISRRTVSDAEESAPVLKPRKGMRYRFTA